METLQRWSIMKRLPALTYGQYYESIGYSVCEFHVKLKLSMQQAIQPLLHMCQFNPVYSSTTYSCNIQVILYLNNEETGIMLWNKQWPFITSIGTHPSQSTFHLTFYYIPSAAKTALWIIWSFNTKNTDICNCEVI
jgi:hypothetical protein